MFTVHKGLKGVKNIKKSVHVVYGCPLPGPKAYVAHEFPTHFRSTHFWKIFIKFKTQTFFGLVEIASDSSWWFLSSWNLLNKHPISGFHAKTLCKKMYAFFSEWILYIRKYSHQTYLSTVCSSMRFVSLWTFCCEYKFDS